MMVNISDSEILWRTAGALDELQGPEAVAVHRYFLAEHSHDEIASHLQMSPEQARQLIKDGLMKMRRSVFDQ